MKSQLFSSAALILLSAVSGALAAEESNLRGVATSISEDYFDLEDYNLEDYELDSFDGEEDVFLGDPCNTRSSRQCDQSHRCERVGRACMQRLDVCTGLSRDECTTWERRDYCRFRETRGSRWCERRESCNGKDRNACNDLSPDCRWDRGDCVRKFEGESDGPTGQCSSMTRNQCDRAMHCMRDSRNDCVPNDLTATE